MTPYHIIIPRHLSLEEQIALAKQDWVSDSFKGKLLDLLWEADDDSLQIAAEEAGLKMASVNDSDFNEILAMAREM